MRNAQQWLATLLLGGAMIAVGCDKGQGTNPPPPAGGNSPTGSTPVGATPSAGAGTNGVSVPTPPTTMPTAGDMNAAAKNAADQATAAANRATTDASAAANNAANATNNATNGAANQANTAANTSSATSDADTQAKGLIDQIQGYIKDNKIDQAQPLMDKLQAMRPQLSPAMQTAVDNVQKAFDGAKAMKTSLPGGLPNLNK